MNEKEAIEKRNCEKCKYYENNQCTLEECIEQTIHNWNEKMGKINVIFKDMINEEIEYWIKVIRFNMALPREAIKIE